INRQCIDIQVRGQARTRIAPALSAVRTLKNTSDGVISVFPHKPHIQRRWRRWVYLYDFRVICPRSQIHPALCGWHDTVAQPIEVQEYENTRPSAEAATPETRSQIDIHSPP